MTEIKIEGDKLIGNIQFDTDDEFAKQIQKKYYKGILNMVSAGLNVVELSDEKNMLLPGQTRMTIKKASSWR